MMMIITASLFFQTANAFAYTTYSNHVLNGGVGNYGYTNRYYFITSSASTYSSLIDSAMYDWINTTSRIGITTPISFVKTSTQSSSIMDIYAGHYYPVEYQVAGDTLHFINSTLVDQWSTNWGFCKNRINSTYFDTISSFYKNHTVSHEMGHVMGLNENNANTSSVMCQGWASPTVYNAQADDANGINFLY